MATEAAVSKEEVKATEDKTLADRAAAKVAEKAAAAEAKRVADEHAATKAHLNEILLLRGLARAFSPHGAEDFAGALDSIANALASGRKLDEPVLIEVAYALKNIDRDWGAMVKKINDILKPAVVTDTVTDAEWAKIRADRARASAPKPPPVESE